MKSIPALVVAVSIFSLAALPAAPFSQIFEGVTVANPDQPSALSAEFPPGTPWTLEGTRGDWSTSAVMNAASFSLLRNTRLP